MVIWAVLDPPIGVFQAHDIVFAQIAARLDLDHFKLRDPGVVQAVDLADGDVGGLVLTEQKDLLALGDLGAAFDHDPVLRAVVVLL
jgi:hypothetical protein